MKSYNLFATVLTLSVVLFPKTGLCQTFEELYQQGEAAQAAGNYSQAELIWKQVLQVRSNDEFVYNKLGYSLYRQKKYDLAVGAYRKSLEINPRNAIVYDNLGNALREQKKFDDAITAYREAIKQNPKYGSAYNNLGYILYSQQKLKEAADVYRQAVENDPINTTFHNNLGNALRDLKQLNEAVKVYREATRLDPRNTSAFNNLGYALYILKQYDQAIKAYREAIKLDPKNATAYDNLGNALYQTKQLSEAIYVYRQALQYNPNSATAYNNLGHALYLQRNISEAIAMFQKAVALKKDTVFYNNLGNAFSTKNQLDNAIKAYREAIKIDPRNVQARNGLGYALVLKAKSETQLSKYQEAIKEFETAISLDPRFFLARNNLIETRRALALRQNPKLLIQDDSRWIPKLEKEPLVNTLRSVVQIIAAVPGGTNMGTGWVVKREPNKAWVLTNRHVVTDIQTQRYPSQQIELEFFSSPPKQMYRPRFTAKITKITAFNDSLDLALLEVSNIPFDINALPIYSGSVNLENPIRVIGHPNGNEWNRVLGKISNAVVNQNIIQVAATLAEGSSGGPILDEENRVIGIVVEIPSESQKLVKQNNNGLVTSAPVGSSGFAYPFNIINKILSDWRLF